MDPAAFRAEFPGLDGIAYLNAGTDGPIPRRSAEAAAAQLRAETERGRSGAVHMEPLGAMKAGVRRHLAEALGCDVGELALTHSTTDGMNTVVSGLGLGRGDEVLTSDEEHPGLLAPLAAARRARGFEIRVVPFAELAGEVRPSTRLVACSHVSWVSGQMVAAPELAATDALVLLDGAQGLGAVRSDVRALGCDFYAGAGQKWLCGPDASGCLYVRADRVEELATPWPGYESLADPGEALELRLREDAGRFDIGPAPGPLAAWWLASLELLREAGWEWVLGRGPELAARLAERLAERGLDVAPRSRSTLVSWNASDPDEAVERMARAGVVVRNLPGRGLVRASVGAWSSEEDLERVVGLVAL